MQPNKKFENFPFFFQSVMKSMCPEINRIWKQSMEGTY